MVINSFHARSGSTAQLDTGDVHVCHICLKQFSRRDLRERHRRRCEKSIGKIIPTKKRSCERCISFKVKCDYEKPSCSRCLNRSVPCEYKLEPRVKVPLNPAFSLGPNTAFSGSLDVFSTQDEQQTADMSSMLDHSRQTSSSLTAPEMVFDLSSSTASTETSLDATLDLANQGYYASTGNECYQPWSHDGCGGSSGSISSNSNGQAPSQQWDATTVWSDASSNMLDRVMMDDAVMEPNWSANLLDLPMCMDPYDQSGMFYGQEYHQPVAVSHARSSGKRLGKSASLSY